MKPSNKVISCKWKVDRIIDYGCEQQQNPPLLHLKESTKNKIQAVQKECDKDKGEEVESSPSPNTSIALLSHHNLLRVANLLLLLMKMY